MSLCELLYEMSIDKLHFIIVYFKLTRVGGRLGRAARLPYDNCQACVRVPGQSWSGLE